MEDVLTRLSELEQKYFSQLDLKFDEIEGESSLRKASREARKDRQKKEITELFDDWSTWFEDTRRMVADPNPYVDVRAVFVG